MSQSHVLHSDSQTDTVTIRLVFTDTVTVCSCTIPSAAVNVKRVSLELGGKSPLIIFADCDMDKAVRLVSSLQKREQTTTPPSHPSPPLTSVQGCQAVFFNKGENCIAAGRLFVERKIHDEFISRVVDEISKMTIGDPLDRSVSHGPQNHK